MGERCACPHSDAQECMRIRENVDLRQMINGEEDDPFDPKCCCSCHDVCLDCSLEFDRCECDDWEYARQAMSDLASFAVLGPPVPKARPRLGRGWHTFTPKRTKKYEELVGSIASLSMPPGWKIDGAYEVTMRVYLPNKRRVDVDNVAKSVLDGMNGVVFADDSQVSALSVRRELDRERPRVEVDVRRVEVA